MSGPRIADADSALALAPGDPDALQGLAKALDDFSTELTGAAQVVESARASTSWSGVSADTFEAAQKEQPDKLNKGAESFHSAAAAIRDYATALTTAQSTARTAWSDWHEAQAATQRWESGKSTAAAAATPDKPAPDPGPDPGEAGREAAQRLMDRANADLDAVAGRSASALHDAQGAAPHKPGLFSRMWHDTTGALDSAWHGVEDGAGWVWDHGGKQLVNTVDYMATHPLEDLKLLADAGLTAVGIVGMAAGIGGEAVGGLFDVTGVGAVVGVPINIAAAGLIGVSAGATYFGLKDGLHDLDTMYNEANAGDDEPTYPSGSDGGPGEWTAKNRGPDKAPWEYQRQVNGTPLGPDGEMYEYNVNGVDFDGYDPGPPPTLLDAKGSYADLLKTKFAGPGIRADFLKEMKGQIDAAGGHDITWVCAEPETAAVVQQIIEDNGFDGLIKVIVQAPK